MHEEDEAEKIGDILDASGYEVVMDPERIAQMFPPPKVPISQAIKDAPKHWP